MERQEENPSVLEKMTANPIVMKAVTSPQILTWATLRVLGSNGGSQDNSEAPEIKEWVRLCAKDLVPNHFAT